MKGLVLAGGQGTRLRPLTWSGPKQLVPVANRPILSYVVDRVVGAGIEEVAIVVAPETARDIERVIGDGAAYGARIRYVVQERPGGLAHAVLAARSFLGDAPFLMVLGDNLIGDALGPFVEGFATRPELAAWLLLKEVDDPCRFGVAVVGADGRVTRLVEKPADPPSRLALVGVYLFRSSILPAIGRIEPSARGELEITDAVNELMREGGEVRFDRLGSFWLDTGKKDDLLLANETVLREWLVPGAHGEVDGASRIEGPVLVEAGARVVRSTVRGPAIVGAGALLEGSVVGPYVSVGERAAIVATEVARSVVLEDARVEGATLSSSIVGRRVVVRSTPDRAASVVLGDDCEITLPRPR